MDTYSIFSFLDADKDFVLVIVVRKCKRSAICVSVAVVMAIHRLA